MDTKRPKILFVDDEVSIRKLFSRMIPHLGYEIVLAEHGEQAFEEFRKHYDSLSVVITDIQMPPGWDGVRLAREIKTAYPDSRIPVLALTGFPRHLTDTGTHIEFAEVIPKPIGIRTLEKTLEKYTGANATN